MSASKREWGVAGLLGALVVLAAVLHRTGHPALSHWAGFIVVFGGLALLGWRQRCYFRLRD